jgi:hypothetical protein
MGVFLHVALGLMPADCLLPILSAHECLAPEAQQK